MVLHLKSVQTTTDTIYQAIVSFSIIKSEEDGRKGKGNSRPGLRDLPPKIGPNVKDTMKLELIRSIATSKTPWDSPSLAIFQQAYDGFFPNYPTTLKIKDLLCSSVCGSLETSTCSQALMTGSYAVIRKPLLVL